MSKEADKKKQGGGLLRSKKKSEVARLDLEGAQAIQTEELIFEEEVDYVLSIGEEKIALQPKALQDQQVKDLIIVLLKWINDILEDRRIIVRHIQEDIYDGQILSEMLEVLTGDPLEVTSLTSAPTLQKHRLTVVLKVIHTHLGIPPDGETKWSVDAIFSKDAVAILHLLVAMARHFGCRHELPPNVQIRRIYFKQLEKKLETKLYQESITGEDTGPTSPLLHPSVLEEKDVFDKLFDQAPQKLETVKQSLCVFVNKHLQHVGIEIKDFETQFYDGVVLIILMGLLDNYFIPLSEYYSSPVGFDQQIHNMRLAFQLMDEANIKPAKAKPEDVVHGDLKSTMRVLYSLFNKYKSTVTSQSEPSAEKK
ncbi:beta-parvin-like [Dysidea avara]|uniref:beta-parvin-like n=1 Tax=Dysidea avara TaxID=196820 RepID=UPI00332838C5